MRAGNSCPQPIPVGRAGLGLGLTYSASSMATGHLYWAVLKRQMSAYWRTGEEGETGGMRQGCSSQAFPAPLTGEVQPQAMARVHGAAGEGVPQDTAPIFHLNGSPNTPIPFHNQESFPEGWLCPEPRKSKRGRLK